MSEAVIDKYAGLKIEGIIRPIPQISDPGFAFSVWWSCPSVGFGEVTFYWDKNKLCVNTEHMGEAFLRRIFSLLVDQMEIRE